MSHHHLIPSRRHFLRQTTLAPLLGLLALLPSESLADNINRSKIQSHLDSITLYLNDIRTLTADVVQIHSSGARNTGKLTIKRPGFLNLAYDPPSPLTLIADSKFLIVVDSQNKNANRIPLAQTPANFFLQRTINLSPRKISILNYQINDKSMWFDVTSSEVENHAKLRISFLKKPLSLLGWTLIEPDNSSTEIYLKKLQLNVPVDPSLFTFNKPRE